MNASEKFIAVVDSARDYVKTWETKLDYENMRDEIDKREDARARLKKAVENWDA